MNYTEVFTREMYAQELAYNLSDDELNKLFGVTKEELEDFENLRWNEALEYEYNNFINEMECSDEMENE